MSPQYLNFVLSKGFLTLSALILVLSLSASAFLITFGLNSSWMLLIHSSPIMPTWFWSLMNLGGDACVVLLIMLLVERRPGEVTSWVLKIWLLGAFLVQLIKYLWPVSRPANVLGLDQLILIDHPPLTGGSMPSGHALAAVCCGLVLFSIYRVRKLSIFLLISIVLISLTAAWARVAVGAHWPADVIAGSGLAFAVVAVSSYWEKRRSWNSWFATSNGRSVLILLHLIIAAHLVKPQSSLESVQWVQFFLSFISLYSAFILFKVNFLDPRFSMEKKR